MSRDVKSRLRAAIYTSWRLSPLFVTILIAIHYLWAARKVQGTWDNDGCYYYGVARHMALTGRYEEPIVWNYLTLFFIVRLIIGKA